MGRNHRPKKVTRIRKEFQTSLIRQICYRKKGGAEKKVTLTPSQLKLKMAILNKLTRLERTVIILHYFEKLSMREIAQVLFVKTADIKNLHGNILSKLNAAVSVH